MWKEAAITTEPVARQLSMMWHAYGRRESKTCGTCVHLTRHLHGDNCYFKCSLYGKSCGAGTDWRKKWLACGEWKDASQP